MRMIKLHIVKYCKSFENNKDLEVIDENKSKFQTKETEKNHNLTKHSI